ncbi:MAG TPA: amidohydrolase family protein [Candidatus Hydrogenedentes bacterium]|nr:amidohydrolase family protein [Candidatus Hydrogenedentota bacterium]
MMRAFEDILGLLGQIPLVDTHEHLWEESHRIGALTEPGKYGRIAAPDFGILLSHYTDSDLCSAGMPSDLLQKITSPSLSPKEKWEIVAPWYPKVRNTGYFLCLRESLRLLYGETDLTADNVESVSAQIRAGIQPGFYEHHLRKVANIDYCHVNSLEGEVFMKTEMPDLLAQDLSFVGFCTLDSWRKKAELADIEVDSLKDWHKVIDWCFEQYGPQAVALKNQMAYGRRLDFAPVTAGEAEKPFERLLADGKDLTADERKMVQDHLFHYCLKKAAEYHLPVKLHTGYYAGHGSMPLERVRQNAGDLCGLLRAYPNVRFDLFHIGYPYQDEYIALAKQYPNAWVDMCWAWIISPEASRRFLAELLVTAPANKVFVFGGDFIPVEMVPGHAAVTRRGVALALRDLVEEGWLAEADVPDMAERLMRGNAHDFFKHPARG